MDQGLQQNLRYCSLLIFCTYDERWKMYTEAEDEDIMWALNEENERKYAEAKGHSTDGMSVEEVSELVRYIHELEGGSKLKTTGVFSCLDGISNRDLLEP